MQYHLTMPKQIPAWAQSSIDTGKLSTTIDNGIKVIGGILATLLVAKGVDPVIVSNNAQAVQGQIDNLIAQYAVIAPAAYSAWHSGVMLYGLGRKAFMWIFGKKVVPMNSGLQYTYNSVAGSNIPPPAQQ